MRYIIKCAPLYEESLSFRYCAEIVLNLASIRCTPTPFTSIFMADDVDAPAVAVLSRAAWQYKRNTSGIPCRKSSGMYWESRFMLVKVGNFPSASFHVFVLVNRRKVALMVVNERNSAASFFISANESSLSCTRFKTDY